MNRAFLSLILVVGFASLAACQQAYPERLSSKNGQAQAPRHFGLQAPASTPTNPQGYFGPLDGVGTAPIPTVKLSDQTFKQFAKKQTFLQTPQQNIEQPERAPFLTPEQSSPQSPKPDVAQTPAKPLEHFPGEQAFAQPEEDFEEYKLINPTQFVSPEGSNGAEQFSAPTRVPGYRETPTRPVRSSYYPNGLNQWDETSLTRQGKARAREYFSAHQCDLSPNHCMGISHCIDEWEGFCDCGSLDWECSCEQFPGPNFLKHHRKCGYSKRGSSCKDCESEVKKLSFLKQFRKNRKTRRKNKNSDADSGCNCGNGGCGCATPTYSEWGAPPIPGYSMGCAGCVTCQPNRMVLEDPVAKLDSIQWRLEQLERAEGNKPAARTANFPPPMANFPPPPPTNRVQRFAADNR